MSTKSIPLTSYQIRLLAVLALINFVNFAARQAVVPLIPLLRDYFHPTDAELGWLQAGLLAVLAAGSIPFGFLADRFSRKAIIGIGIFFWSAASFAGGLVSTRSEERRVGKEGRVRWAADCECIRRMHR